MQSLYNVFAILCKEKETTTFASLLMLLSLVSFENLEPIFDWVDRINNIKFVNFVHMPYILENLWCKWDHLEINIYRLKLISAVLKLCFNNRVCMLNACCLIPFRISNERVNVWTSVILDQFRDKPILVALLYFPLVVCRVLEFFNVTNRSFAENFTTEQLKSCQLYLLCFLKVLNLEDFFSSPFQVCFDHTFLYGVFNALQDGCHEL